MATTLMLLLLSLLRCCSLASLALGLNPIDVVTRDFRALTRRVTAHHILLPKSRDVALALKQRIRNEVSPPTVPSLSSLVTSEDSGDVVEVVILERSVQVIGVAEAVLRIGI